MSQSLDLMVNVLSAHEKLPKLMEDIRKPALPIFVTNWVLGIGIIEYPFGTQHQLITFLYAGAIQVAYCLVAFNGYPSLVSMAKEFKINLRLIQILFFSQIVLCICSSILGWFRTKGMQEILQRIAVADYMLELIGISKDYAQVLKSQIRQVAGFSLFILIFVTINAINMLATDTTNSGKIMVIFAISYPTIIVFIVDSTFIITMEYIRLKFKKLNKLLRKMCTTTSNDPQHTRVARAFSKVYGNKINSDREYIIADNTYTIHTAKKAHVELVKICQVADNIYGLHIIMSLTAATGIITGCLYYLYILLRHTTVSGKELTRLLSFIGIWIIYCILKVLTYCICCNAVSNESIETGEIISEFYDEPVINEETKSEIRDFHVQLIQNSLEFTANGFININIALLQTMTGSIITFLMILIQLGDISSPSDPAQLKQ